MKLKKIHATKQFKIYRDDNRKYYFRRNEGKIRRLRLWPKKWYSRFAFILALLLLIGTIAYKPVMQYAADKVVQQVADKLLSKEEIEELVKLPEVQQILREQGLLTDDIPIPIENTSSNSKQQESVASHAQGQGQESSPVVSENTKMKLQFASNEEALRFLLTKFSMNELNDLIAKARGGLTKENKAEILAIVTKRLSPEEFEALKIRAVIELKKRQG